MIDIVFCVLCNFNSFEMQDDNDFESPIPLVCLYINPGLYNLKKIHWFFFTFMCLDNITRAYSFNNHTFLES